MNRTFPPKWSNAAVVWTGIHALLAKMRFRVNMAIDSVDVLQSQKRT
jgi:hypothetical protein